MQIIKDGAIVEDAWVHVADDAALPASGAVTESLERYAAQREALTLRGAPLGVRLRSDQEAKSVAPYVA